MRPLRAVTLPAVRDELSAQMLREVLVFAEHAAGDDRVDKVRTLWLRQANAMKTSSMWWVAPDMATLAADTGLSGDDMRSANARRQPPGSPPTADPLGGAWN